MISILMKFKHTNRPCSGIFILLALSHLRVLQVLWTLIV